MSVTRLGKRRGDEGFALPMALAFLVIAALITTVILQYAATGDRMSGKLASERNNVYAAQGAIDAAIRYAQSDTTQTLGSGNSSDATCPSGGGTFFTTPGPNGTTITVTCSASGSGAGAGGDTTAPPFAILTLAPYHGPSPSSGCVNVNNELGIVQFQHSKLLYINGDVYVNSDVDADIWSGGCPQYFAALPMVALGSVYQRESNHDFCAGPTAYDSQCSAYLPLTKNYKYVAPISNTQFSALPAATQSMFADPGITNPTMWAPEISSPPAAGTVRDKNNNVITSCPAIDPVSGYRLVKFTPGTFSDVTIFNTLMGGGCPNAIFWFQPGTYYFNFTNAGTHEWAINDTTTRVVGGQPFPGPAKDATPVSATWKPTVAGTTSLFANPANAFGIDLTTSNATIANGQTASLQLKTYVSPDGSSIPADAQINSVRLRVAHGEDNPALVNSPTVTITPGNSGASACAAVTLNKHTGVTEDASYDVTNCLNDVSKINGAMSLTYSVAHCSPTGGTCTTASTADHVDGIWLDVTYTTGARPAWNPDDPTTISPSSPVLPGACVSDRDSKKTRWTDGVQFVFSGDSRVNLKSGKVELCDKPQSSDKQEITVYGVRGATASAPVTSNWNAVTAATSGYSGQDNAKVINDGLSATGSFTANGTKTVTLSQFSPNAWPIPAASQIPAGSTINTVNLLVRHGESSTSLSTPTVTITPAGASACGVNTLTKRTSGLGTDTINVTSCLNTAAKINGGVSLLYTQARTTGFGTMTSTLEGVQLQVTYTPPPTGGGYGSLAGETGCITQTPYYSPTDHSPAYNGACALIRISDDANGGSFPRTLTIWGTAYAPSAAFDVPVDLLTAPVFARGVVARMLMLGYNITNNAIVPITETPYNGTKQDNREFTLTTTVPGSTTGIEAKVKLCDLVDSDCPTGANGGSPPVKVLSWKVTR